MEAALTCAGKMLAGSSDVALGFVARFKLPATAPTAAACPPTPAIVAGGPPPPIPKGEAPPLMKMFSSSSSSEASGEVETEAEEPSS